MKIQRILAGIDFEKQTEHILAYASLFAAQFGASLYLLHVIDYLVTPPAYLDQYMNEEMRAAEEKYEAIKQELSSFGLAVDSKVVVGRLHESFEASAKKTGADLLILGFVSHAVRRSSSEKLIKGLQMPMLVVRGAKSKSASAGNLSVRKILCPVDFSDISKKALEISRELTRIFSSDMEILHVFPEAVGKKIKAHGNKNKIMKEMYEQEKNRFTDFLSDSYPDSTRIMDQGEPHKKIVALAKETDTDLIVMGARGLGLIKGMLIGSVTDAVLKAAPCPVLVIH